MAKGQLEAGWFVNCGANMCRNKEAAPGSPIAVEKHLAAKGWLSQRLWDGYVLHVVRAIHNMY